MKTRSCIAKIICGFGLVLATISGAFAAQPGGAPGAQAPGRVPGLETPPLFFRETWKQEREGLQFPVGPEVVSNPNLELKLYGASAKELLVTGNSKSPVIWLFNGLTTTPIAATLRHKDSYVDLSGAAKIRWTIRTSGFHVMRPVVKLADGTWLIGDRADSSPAYFNEIEYSLANIRWLPFDAERVVTKNQTDGQWIDRPDLTKVDEIGYADLMPGSGHGFGGWASLGAISVYGTPVKR